MFLGIGLGLTAQAIAGAGQNPLAIYGTPHFLFDVPRSQYKNGSALTSSFSSLSGLTFTRASTGYAQTSAGVLLPFASGVPRITDKGLLVEGARTNLCLQSQTFDNAAWVSGLFGAHIRPTVTANVGVAPDGTTTSDLLTATHATASTISCAIVAAAVSTSFTGSVWIRAGTSASATLGLSYGLGGAYVSGSGSACALTSLWQRFTVTATTPGAGIDQIQLSITVNSGVGLNIEVWGGQLEQASFGSSYIPTTTASVTRAADVASIAVSGLAYPLTMFWEGERVSTLGSNAVCLAIDDGTTANEVIQYVGGGGAAAVQSTSGSVSQAVITVGSVSVGAVSRSAARITTNDINVAKGGTLGTADTSCANPTTPSRITLGMRGDGTLVSFQYFKRFGIWPTAFTDANIQAVST